MKYNAIKNLLTETSSQMKKLGVDMFSEYPQIMSEDTLFENYKLSLAEGLEGDAHEEFLELADLVREGVLIETVYGFKPQAQLIMPIFRKMWPQSFGCLTV